MASDGGGLVPRDMCYDRVCSRNVIAPIISAQEAYINRAYIGMINGIRDGLPDDRALGWGNYYDTATAITPIQTAENEWTDLTCDNLDPQTLETYLPPCVDHLWDPVSNMIDLTCLSVGQTVFVRCNFQITPSENNTRVSIRAFFENEFYSFDLTRGLAALSEGANIIYPRVENFHFYIGAPEIVTGSTRIQILTSSASQVRVNGFYINIS